MSIVPLNIGSASNDGNGQDLRSGGQVINANFAELDQRTTAAQSAADAAQAKADTAQAKADSAIPSLQKGQPNGVAGLDGSGTVPASQLPSYVDDVLEFGSFSALPAAGETGKIYITTDTNSQYRWSGTQYVLLTASPGSTDAVPEGAVNKYWTLARTLGSALAGLVTTNPAVIAATDTVLAAFGKLQRQITDLTTSVANKAANGDNNDITSLRALTVDGFDRIRQGVAPFVGATASVAGTKGLVPAPSVADRLNVLRGDGTYVALPTGAAWGAITGTLSAQVDLQEALDKKLSKSYSNLFIARANFTASTTPTISFSSNVLSVTRVSTGLYRLTLSAPIKAGWMVLGTVPGTSGATYTNIIGPNTPFNAGSTVEVLLVSAGGGNLVDPNGVIAVAIVGEWA